jgi:glycyl-tRNA synthetase beta chain
VRRLRRLADLIAPRVGAGPALAERAAELAKADLVTGMVGEFPELQGIMGRYYALHDGEPRWPMRSATTTRRRDRAIAVPTDPVSIAVALADKLDQLAGFFAIGEKPTGAGDPYALRRAALGIIRIIRENKLRLPLLPLIEAAGQGLHHHGVHPVPPREILEFLAERLRIQLRAEGARHDVLAAVFAATGRRGPHPPAAPTPRLLARAEAVSRFLGQEDGANLLAAYRRAANILRIEEAQGRPVIPTLPDSSLLAEPAEEILHRALIAGLAATLVQRENTPGDGLPGETARFRWMRSSTRSPSTRRNRNCAAIVCVC